MPSTAETDAEDVNDFLKRIQELGIKRDQEDEERNKKLEEEILQGRKERQARRAERARSISPIKDSPANTPPSYNSVPAEVRTQSPSAAFTPSRELQRSSQSSNREQLLDETMGHLTGEDPHTKGHAPSATDRSGDAREKDLSHTNPARPSPSSAMPSRSPTLSWQRRPNSQASDRSKTQPLSMTASQNATRFQRYAPELSPDDTASMGRNEIAQSLAAKDPAWFRQTSDRGQSSAAYRKTQVEDNVVDEAVPNTSRIQMPGMSRTPIKEFTDSSNVEEPKQMYTDLSSSLLRSTSPKESIALSSADSFTTSRTGFVSPMPATIAQRFAQPGQTTPSDGNRDQSISTRTIAMSPSQGRILPERLDRPVSPTKGMGGFVQSAMMKRSDSVNKRWSVQSPGGLARGNSVASNRSVQDPAPRTPLGNILNSTAREPRPSSLSRESTPFSTSRPSSSHSSLTVALEDGHQGSIGVFSPSASELTQDGNFAKPGIPASQIQAPLDTYSVPQVDRRENSARNETSPESPSKSTDTRRWSPTKSSWLESALNKPDSPKPKQSPPKQPSWMVEINKAKQRVPGEETLNKPATHKHQVSIGGLLRSPPMGGIAKPLSIGGLPLGFSSGAFPISQSSKVSDAISKTKIVNSDVPDDELVRALKETSSQKSEVLKTTEPVTVTPSFSAVAKSKPETPPKKDFRPNLKQKQPLTVADSKEEPEFKNVFGQLRRTKTQNYVAPDELKDNILRGKAGLNFTGGPKKTERRDEFKEAILKKKEDFKKAQQEGTGVTQSTAAPIQTQLPEALLKKATLGMANIVVSGTRDNNSISDKDSSEVLSKDYLPSSSTKPKMSPEISAPAMFQSKLDPESKLAGRFNPALATLLARGPPPKPEVSSTKVASGQITSSRRLATKEAEHQSSGPQLTHMTKGRARGPQRKAPSALTSAGAQMKTAIP